MAKKGKKEPVALFQNKLIERLTKSSARFTYSYYFVIMLVFHGLNVYFEILPLTSTLAVFFGGLLFWTFFEYMMHRYVFHLPGDSEAAEKFRYTLHGIHHDFPNDKDRLFLPPIVGTGIVLLLLGVFWLVMGKYVFAFLPGMVLGYILYSLVHYTLHTARPPKFLHKQLLHHNLHHYKYPNKAFGVSSPLWDLIFGTMPPKPQEKRRN